MLKINIYWHKCSCHKCDDGQRTTDNGRTECEDRARILKQNSQFWDQSQINWDQLDPSQDRAILSPRPTTPMDLFDMSILLDRKEIFWIYKLSNHSIGLKISESF